jgi:hypothetical protein
MLKANPVAIGLDKELNRLLAEMSENDPNSDEYAKLLERIVKLHKLKEDESPGRISADTRAMIFANLVGILIIIGYERANVISSKALNFVSKLK